MNEATETFDNNGLKDVYARLTQEIGEHYVGGFAYFGRGRGVFSDGDAFNDDFVRVGADAFVDFSPVIVYGSALYARDDNRLGTGGRRSLWGGFVEGDYFLNDRTVRLARLDVVRQNVPAFLTGSEAEEEGAGGSTGAEPGEVEGPFRVNTVSFTPGIQYLVLPNVKLDSNTRYGRRAADSGRGGHGIGGLSDPPLPGAARDT